MATVSRIEPRYSPMASGSVAVETGYVGRHRRVAARGFSLRRLFYLARHGRR